MKKLLLLLAICMISLATKAQSYGTFQSGNLIYEVTDNNISHLRAQVVGNTSREQEDIIVPYNVSRDVDNYIIEAIGPNAFAGNHLKTIKTSYRINWIKESSFSQSTIQRFDCPEDLKAIYNWAFSQCYNLETIVFNSRIREIHEGAFSYCKRLRSIKFPSKIEYIGPMAFSGCAFKNLTLPDNPFTMGECAFLNCDSLMVLDLGKGITDIPANAFGNAPLPDIIIPDQVKTIGWMAFNSLWKTRRTLVLGRGVTEIGGQAFSGNTIKNVICLAKVPPTCTLNYYSQYDTFDYTTYRDGTLYVPLESIELYKETEPWKRFEKIVATDGGIPEIPKCAKPTISYKDGRLSFESETEGVEFVSSIQDEDIKEYTANGINLCVKYDITVYATKLGIFDSEKATATLCWIEAEPKKEGIKEDEDVIAEVKAIPVLIQNDGGTLSISGAREGSLISVYNLAGQMVGSAIASKTNTTINTTLQNNDVGIVKIGDKSVKITIQ